MSFTALVKAQLSVEVLKELFVACRVAVPDTKPRTTLLAEADSDVPSVNVKSNEVVDSFPVASAKRKYSVVTPRSSQPRVKSSA